MNTIDIPRQHTESDYKNGHILFRDFRHYQYELLPEILQACVSYISKQNNNFLEVNQLNFKSYNTYYGVYNNEYYEIELIVNNKKTSQTKTFLRMYFPRLIDGSYFIINGNTYIPTIYILDKPITLKAGSIKLYSLFNSLTLFLKDDVCIFTGVNIPSSYFIQLFFNDTPHEHLYDDNVEKFKLTHDYHQDDELINYFNRTFNLHATTRNQVIEYFEKLFFDQYTEGLYAMCYNDVSLYNLIKQSLIMLLNETSPSFIDLKNKRLVFIELLLSPLLKYIGKIAKSAANGYTFDEVNMKLDELTKYFIKTTNKQKQSDSGLDGNYLFSSANLYESILEHKCSFVNPGSTNPPNEIAALHDTHYKVLCPITVADMQPGHTVSVIPDTVVDYFGNFKNI